MAKTKKPTNPYWKNGKTGKSIEAKTSNGVEGKTDIVFMKGNKVTTRLSLTNDDIQGLKTVLKDL